MALKKDYSYGVIPIFKKSADGPYFLLARHSAGHWGFPKGHKEVGENDIEAAKRELFEEAGISEIEIDDSMKFYEKYIFEENNETIDKTVTFFPGFVSGRIQPKTDGKEIVDAEWFGYDSALQKITYPESKKLLQEVLERLAKKHI